MKPIGNIKGNCTPTSSNCVKWPAIELEGVDLCSDSSVTEVILALNDKLNTMANSLDIDIYELECLGLDKCGPKEFSDLVQLIINKVCSLSRNGGFDLDATTFELYDIGCGTFPDGDYSIPQFAEIVARKICEIISAINTLGEQYSELNRRLNSAENDINNLESSKQDKLDFGEKGDAQTYLTDRTQWTEDAENKIGNLEKSFTICQNRNSLSGQGTLVFDGSEDKIIDNINFIYTLLCDARQAIDDMKSAVNTITLDVVAFATCSKVWYKASSSVVPLTSTIKDVVIDGTSIGPQTITADDTWQSFNISISPSTDIQNAKFEITYDDNGTTRTTSKLFSIRKAIDGMNFTVNDNYATININKVINCVGLSLYRQQGSSTPILIGTIAAEQTGNITINDAFMMTAGTSYYYYVNFDGESSQCYNDTVQCPYPPSVSPIIEGLGYNNNDGIFNSVPPEDYNDWYSLLTD